jgi:cyclic pyranopterin monophosphate synthase
VKVRTYGLVLTGGRSLRMGEDKALISYRGEPHAVFIRNILKTYCEEVFISSREDQWRGTALENLPTLFDREENQGPIAGILSAFAKFPSARWLIVATDLRFFNSETVEKLLEEFDDQAIATCFMNRKHGFPEPLCALYSPAAKSVFEDAWSKGQRGPVSILQEVRCHLLEQSGSINLANVNSPGDRDASDHQ